MPAYMEIYVKGTEFLTNFQDYRCLNELRFEISKRLYEGVVDPSSMTTISSYMLHTQVHIQCWESYFVKVTSYILHITCNRTI